GAAVDEEFDPIGKCVELPQQGDAWRLQGIAQGALFGRTFGRFGDPNKLLAAAPHLVVVDIEFAGEQLKETLAPGAIEREIVASEIGGARTRRDTAGTPVETAQHL